MTIEPASDPASFTEKDPKDGRDNEAFKQSRVSKERKEPEWEKFSSKELGIKMSSISKPTKLVLSGLKRSGICLLSNYALPNIIRDS